MSVQAIRWAFNLETPSTIKLVLVALADHADDGGICWPSQTRLALMTGLTTRSVRTAMGRLMASGLIRHDPKKGRLNQMKLAMEIDEVSPGMADILRAKPERDAQQEEPVSAKPESYSHNEEIHSEPEARSAKAEGVSGQQEEPVSAKPETPSKKPETPSYEPSEPPLTTTSSLRSEGALALPPHGIEPDVPAHAKPPRAKTGHRLPGDWALTPDLRAFAEAEGLPDPDRTAERFRDHWHSKTGADARKTDWAATWRNWVRRESDWGQRSRGGGGAPRLTPAQQRQQDVIDTWANVPRIPGVNA